MRRTDYAWTGWCTTHSKVAHPSRKAARRVARRMSRRLRAYECDAVDGWWHCGHLAPEVVAGRTTMRDVVARRAAG